MTDKKKLKEIDDPFQIKVDQLQLERERIWDIIVKTIGYIFFLIFAIAGLLSIIYKYSVLFDLSLSAEESSHYYIFKENDAIILGIHYLGLSIFFATKAFLRNAANKKLQITKYLIIAISLGLSLICFIIVGLKIGTAFTITTPIAIILIAFIFYLMYKAISEFV